MDFLRGEFEVKECADEGTHSLDQGGAGADSVVSAEDEMFDANVSDSFGPRNDVGLRNLQGPLHRHCQKALQLSVRFGLIRIPSKTKDQGDAALRTQPLGGSHFGIHDTVHQIVAEFALGVVCRC